MKYRLSCSSTKKHAAVTVLRLLFGNDLWHWFNIGEMSFLCLMRKLKIPFKNLWCRNKMKRTLPLHSNARSLQDASNDTLQEAIQLQSSAVLSFFSTFDAILAAGVMITCTESLTCFFLYFWCAEHLWKNCSPCIDGVSQRLTGTSSLSITVRVTALTSSNPNLSPSCDRSNNPMSETTLARSDWKYLHKLKH